MSRYAAALAGIALVGLVRPAAAADAGGPTSAWPLVPEERRGAVALPVQAAPQQWGAGWQVAQAASYYQIE